MTVYARSDLAAVLVSEAHGGCNTPGGHRRWRAGDGPLIDDPEPAPAAPAATEATR